MLTTSPAPSHQARAGHPFLDTELNAWESWPAPDVSPAGYYRAPLGAEAVRFFQENGFLVLENAMSADEIAELNADAARICRGDYGAFRGLEPGGPGETDLETISRYLCIHFPHKMSPVMHRALSHPSQVEVLTKVIGPDVKCMQSMLFIKGAGKPGQAWHQDEFFIPTRDRSLIGGWMALDDATVENGCLWVLPGSHKKGIIYPAHSHSDRRFDCTGEAEFPFRDEDAVPVEVKAGSIVFFNGYLLHRSLPNRAKSGFRRVLVNHYMSANSLLPWTSPEKPTGMGTHDYRDIVMVAGEDPYAWKGVEDLAAPHVRPSGQGGCGDPKQNLKTDSAMAAPRMG
ncbi:MAG TPA: phytanoyl-CoA dioxygenase family protein [Chthoniobacterales bacterium]|jgi:hypothetical protein